MYYIKKIGTAFLISITTFILLLLILTLLSYLNIIKGNAINIISLILPIISTLIGSIYLGKLSNKKGWLEGLKLGILFIIIFVLINLIIYKRFILRTLIYYSIFLISSVLGSMVGINLKRKH